MKNKKLKIVFSQYDDISNPVYAGGGAHAVHELAKRFTKDHHVTVLTGTYEGAKNKTIDGVKYLRIGSKYFGPQLGQIIYHLLLPLYAKRIDHDIWFESFTPPFSTSFLPLVTNKPVVGLVHMLSGKDMRRKYKLPFDWLESLGLKVYRNYIVMNSDDKKMIKKSNPDAEVQVLHNGTDLPNNVKLTDPQHILFLGRIEVDQKGLDLLIRAYSKNRKRIGLPLVIAGDGQKKEVEKLKGLIDQHNLETETSLAGRIEGKKKIDLIKSSACVVIPSRYETFSIVALEAMSYGIPIVTFDIDGLGWIPEHLRSVARPFDVNAFGRAIVRITNEPSIRKTYSSKAIKFTKDYSWDNVYKKYISYTQQLTDQSSQIKDSDFKIIIDKSIKIEKTFVFVSPHLDDAIFSTGGLISYLSKRKAKVEVVNIFTKGSPPPYTRSAKRNLFLNGFSDANKLYNERKKEDGAVFKDLGVNVNNLGFLEALYRKKNSINNNILSEFLPEFNHIYPTFRFHILRGVVSSHDNLLVDKIIGKLRTRKDDQDMVVFCPIGSAGHVDHIVARKTSEQVFTNIIYYEDSQCYNEKDKSKFINANRLKRAVFQIDRENKLKLVNCYATQARSLSKNDIHKLTGNESYYLSRLS